MFGNKFYHIKLFGSLGLFLVLCLYGYREGRWINPDPIRASVLEPGYDGKTLWIPGTQIKKMNENGFLFQQGETDVRVIGKEEWMKEGMFLEFTGTFRSNPPTLELIEARPNRIIRWWKIILAGSIITIAGVIILFFRRFRIRREAWEVKWPTS